MSKDDNIHVFKPNPDDWGFNIKTIQKGYAAIGALLFNKDEIDQAIDNYHSISNHTAASDAFLPENTAERLTTDITRLRQAVSMWDRDAVGPKNQFQRSYEVLVRAAHMDCLQPLATIDEATTVLKRAIDSTMDEDATTHVAAGLSHDELVASYTTLMKLRNVMHGFAKRLETVHVHGNMAIGKTEHVEKELARPVTGEKDTNDHTREVLCLGLVGMFSAEKEHILKVLDNMPRPRGEELKTAFLNVSDKITGFAKYHISKPEDLARSIDKDIPRCIEALREVKSHLDGAKDFVGGDLVDIILGCIERLHDPSKGKKPGK